MMNSDNPYRQNPQLSIYCRLHGGLQGSGESAAFSDASCCQRLTVLRPLCSEVPGIWGCTDSHITAFLISRLILVPDVTPGGYGQALLKSLVGAEALQLTVPTPMRARCCACFLQAINCYTEGRLCGPTGCQASCIWATAGQGSEGGLTSGREFPDFAKDSESGLQEFSAEQS